MNRKNVILKTARQREMREREQAMESRERQKKRLRERAKEI